jgi:hypothetical protein
MTDKARAPAPTPATTSSGVASWDFLTDLGRKQFAFVTESACALFRGMEAMRTVQQRTAHQALAEHTTAAQKLHAACTPTELLAIQSALLGSDVQGAMQYWQQLGSAAFQAQLEWVDGSKKILPATSEEALKPLLQAWQNAMPHPFNKLGHPLSS